MQTPEFQELLTSVQNIVSDAYALGRSDALKRVVEVLRVDAPSPKPLALMSPTEDANKDLAGATQDNDNAVAEAATRDAAMATDHATGGHGTGGHGTGGHPTGQADRVVTGPWWSRPPRRA